MREKHAWEKWDKENGGWMFDEEKARARFEDATVDGDGVVRWKSNSNVPPDDCLQDWDALGLEFDIVQSRHTSERDTKKFMAEYRESMKNHKPDAEEMFEMRAAFGEGETVVNIFTGQETKL